jgi:hypothetical protein
LLEYLGTETVLEYHRRKQTKKIRKEGEKARLGWESKGCFPKLDPGSKLGGFSLEGVGRKHSSQKSKEQQTQQEVVKLPNQP